MILYLTQFSSSLDDLSFTLLKQTGTIIHRVNQRSPTGTFANRYKSIDQLRKYFGTRFNSFQLELIYET